MEVHGSCKGFITPTAPIFNTPTAVCARFCSVQGLTTVQSTVDRENVHYGVKQVGGNTTVERAPKQQGPSATSEQIAFAQDSSVKTDVARGQGRFGALTWPRDPERHRELHFERVLLYSYRKGACGEHPKTNAPKNTLTRPFNTNFLVVEEPRARKQSIQYVCVYVYIYIYKTGHCESEIFVFYALPGSHSRIHNYARPALLNTQRDTLAARTYKFNPKKPKKQNSSKKQKKLDKTKKNKKIKKKQKNKKNNIQELC